MDRKPDTIIGRKVYYPGAEGMYVLSPGKPPELITQRMHMAELPPGDWDMRVYQNRVILADKSGQNPPMAVDKDGNWEILKPTFEKDITNAT